jgi:L-serine dehydratase
MPIVTIVCGEVMAISVFELFTIGIGPSSSHTVGPMRAARMFAQDLLRENLLNETASIQVSLYGSLGATGRGHGTDRAVLAGLAGERPETADPIEIQKRLESANQTHRLQLLECKHEIALDPARDLKFERKSLPYHSNGMTFVARRADNTLLSEKTFYSVGGGFVVNERTASADRIIEDQTALRYHFNTAAQLLAYCEQHHMSIASLMMENEKAWRMEAEIRAGLLEIWSAMQQCVARGCLQSGVLPGGLKVKRRAGALFQKLSSETDQTASPLLAMDWVNLWALAVNEENAAGGRVVTAPTNGAAGIIPAVLHYYHRFHPTASDDGTVRFLLTAAAIGILFKMNASISGAEVGCQGEVGSACSMAAGGLAEALGGTPTQVENAAEIGMEHNLGLTCDPIGGLVQIPCIERNAMAAVKAINAAQLALRGDGQHFVSLDKVIKTMRETGRDMKTKYKETSRGGLAVNVIEC